MYRRGRFDIRFYIVLISPYLKTDKTNNEIKVVDFVIGYVPHTVYL